jgi:hypothetical protein
VRSRERQIEGATPVARGEVAKAFSRLGAVTLKSRALPDCYRGADEIFAMCEAARCAAAHKNARQCIRSGRLLRSFSRKGG